MVNNKFCKYCGNYYPPSTHFFHRYHKGKYGLMTMCKQCKNKNKGFTEHVPDGHKRCYKCKQVFPATTEYFYGRIKETKTILSSYCKPCSAIVKAEYESNNAGKVLERQRKYREANREHIREQHREYEKTEKYRARQRARNKHPETIEYRRLYWKSSRGKAVRKVANNNRRTRILSLPSEMIATDWRYALEYFHGCCAVCGRQLNDLFGEHTAAMDHWIPLSSPDCPGTVPTNMIPLCHGVDGCNNSKKNRDAMEWLVWKFGKRRANEINRRIQEYFELVLTNQIKEMEP